MNQNKQNVLGITLAALSIIVWGITFVSTKYLLNDFSSLEILFYRFVTAYIGLWLMRPKYEKIRMKDNLLFFLAALSGVVLYQLSENIAIHFTSASNVSIIVSICPLFTAIISQIFLKEKHLTICFITGFVISITGIALVCFNGTAAFEFNPRGDLLAFLAGLCWGFYSVLVSVINRRKYNRVASTRRIFFFAVLVMIPFSLAGWTLSKTQERSEFVRSLFFVCDSSLNAERFSNPFNWVNLLFLGIVASGLCFTLWNKACQILGTVKVSCAIYLIPVITIIAAFFILGEKITLTGALGTVITIAGLFISELQKKEHSSE